MAGVTPSRYRWGALAWLLTLQFFVVEAVAALQADGYSRADDLVSALGAAGSPAHVLMNASFIAQGLLIGAGAVLLRPALAGTGGRLAPVFLTAAAVGVALVGVFPQGGQDALHEAGAGLYLVGGGLALIALAYAVRPRSEVLGTGLAVLGLVGTAMTVFFVAGITGHLGEGGTERAAAYVLPIGLALAGAGLWRLAGRPVADDRPTRRELRERERAERADRARERDAALEAGVRPPGPAQAEEPDEDFDPEDPWARTQRRE
ncbi:MULTISPECIES: DUF998 domain-containing protein [unclassified Geodermatophilus]|uniref:DUF998 domain-containing protein n=1 Tax=unclassified Geodermatophilus TaxID=2637632 RepID=UPI003EEF4E3F